MESLVIAGTNAETAEQVALLQRMQREHLEWANYNFPDRKPHMPVLGMIEEMGELCDAVETFARDDVYDAIGDIMVFMLDCCNQRKVDIGHVYRSALLGHVSASPMSTVGKLARAVLKQEQGIRDIDEKIVVNSLISLARFCLWTAHVFGWHLVDVVSHVWGSVKKRDWQKDKSQAGVL